MTNVIFTFLVIVPTIFLLGLYACAADIPSVTIEVLSQKQTYEQQFTASVKVTFNDISLYNESQQFSFHVYRTPENTGAEDTENSLAYENARVPIVLDSNNSAYFDIIMDMTGFEYEDAYILFDIVDVENVYWMLGSNVNVQFDNIHCIYNPFMQAVQAGLNEIRTHSIIFAINVIVFVLSIVLIVYTIKHKIFSFKRKEL